MTPSDIATLKHALAKTADTPGSFVAYAPHAGQHTRYVEVGYVKDGEAHLIDTSSIPLAHAQLRHFAIVTRLALD